MTRALGRLLKSVFVVVAGVMAAILLIVVGAILLGGGIGDPGYSVTVTNGTSETLVFYVDDVGAKAGEAIFEGVRLAPGGDDVNHWIVPTNSGDTRRATGQLLDPSGLYYMRARWYDATSGRLVSRDRAPADTHNPASLNVFAYANVSPIVRDDPTGLRVTTGGEVEGGRCDADCIARIAASSRHDAPTSVVNTPAPGPAPIAMTTSAPTNPPALASRSAATRHPLTWALADDVLVSATLVLTGAALVAGGATLIGTGLVETATGPGVLVGVPSIALGTEMIGIGAVSFGAGLWFSYETVWLPVHDFVLGPE